jgi:predicted GNAT family N-acyltransferase
VTDVGADPRLVVTRADTRDALLTAVDIRRQVFGDEQRIVLPRYDDDEDWIGGITLLAWLGELPVCTGRLLPGKFSRQGVADIAWVATLPAFRGLGAATRVMEELLRIADDLGEERVYLSAQVYAQDLYLRLGFQPFLDEYTIHGIKHRPMVRQRAHGD